MKRESRQELGNNVERNDTVSDDLFIRCPSCFMYKWLLLSPNKYISTECRSTGSKETESADYKLSHR
jgi:hypothetical protein